MTFSEEVNKLVERAKKDGRKGDYRVYVDYTQRLGLLCSSSYEYQEACKAVSRALKL